ncbi:MAG: c-type cytochrome biogenesis protein CcmI [Duodenibacillus sp.]|nr:c-type cytochrome biogenesis protein CcmI [Duodenibacillus sp.]
MLLTFICIALAMTAAALAAAAWPLLSVKRLDGEARRTGANLALLREQFKELEAGFAAGSVPEDEYRETRAEIELRVLEETEAQQEAGEAAPAGRKGLAAALALAVAIPACAFLCYMQIGSPRALDPEFTREQAAMAHAMGGRHSDSELREQIKKIEERLKVHPDNPDGWLMLARANEALREWGKASQAFAELNRLIPGNADILSDWADMLAASQNRNLEGRPAELVQEALKVDPRHWKALALMGTICFNRKDFRKAVIYWERMRAGTEQGGEEWRQITESIEQARQMGGIGKDEKVADDLPPAPSAEDAKRDEALARAFVTGSIELAPALKDKVRPEDVVFVFARPVAGGKMPVAFIRMHARDLPTRFRLDNSSGMGQGVKTLADVSEVLVEARVSRSGNFMPQPGDLQGAAKDKVAVGAEGVHVLVDRVLP